MPIDRNNAQYITGALYKPTQTSAPGVWDLDDQANNIAKNLWPLPPQAVQRSLRFNSADSTSLNWTPSSAGNQYTFTTSMWVKRSSFGSTQHLGAYSEFCHFGFDSDETMYGNLRGTGGTNYFWISSAKFRDPSAWYHLVFAVDTANATSTNRFKFYVNGVEQTFSTISYPPQNLVQVTASIRYLGRYNTSIYHFNGYMAEVNFVDGQVLTPTSFGETDPQTGVWIPKRYTGTYGTNGFRLSFANNSSTAALGYDSSGAGNNWTPNNFSVTPGAGNDSLLDVPSLYGTDTGLGGEVLGNYCTWNPLDKDANVTLANGNLDLTAYNQSAYATWPLYSGKWYYEITLIDPYNGTFGSYWGYHGLYGVQRSSASLNNATFTGIYCNTSNDGDVPGVYTLGSRTLVYRTFANNDILGFAVDIDARTMTIYKNGLILSANITIANSTPMYIGSTLNGSAGDPGTVTANFGQRPFTYAAPLGFKALCTTNLPAPAIGQTSSNQADNHFNVVTWTGDGTTSRTISGVGFQPDLVWAKRRNIAGDHGLMDSLRGATARLISNSTAIEDTSFGLSAFTSDGFVTNAVNTAYNVTSDTHVAWCWNAGGTTATNTSGTITSQVRANQRAGFSIVTYTGTGANGTVGHGLSSAPQFLIVRNRDTVYNWRVWHTALSGTQLLYLNTTDATVTDAAMWNSTIPTSSVFNVGTNGGVNESTKRIIAYCFAAVPGFSAFGSYIGNGSSDGPFVYTGFRPKWVLVKSTSAVGDWALLDTTRDVYNLSQAVLYPNATYAEDTANVKLDIVSNGFKFRSTIGNGSGTTYVYIAFAETPARLSTAR